MQFGLDHHRFRFRVSAAIIGWPVCAVLTGCEPRISRNVNDNRDPAADASAGLVYLLQPGDTPVTDLIALRAGWIVLEPSRGGGDAASEFSSEDIASIRSQGPCGEKQALAYLSVGEAEDYRDYWDPAWVDEEGNPIEGVAPSWLGPGNPEFPGNYKVRYWDPAWQALMLGTPGGARPTPLDRIIDAGYSGVYLDIIDAYLYWSEEGENELSRAEARRRMIAWIERIAEYARVTRGARDFLVFPQNAEDIIRDDRYEFDDLTDAYFDAVSGIGIEDLFYDETRPQPEEDVEYRLEQLAEFRARGKVVLVTDYVIADPMDSGTSAGRVADFYARTIAETFVPYAATQDRELDRVIALTAPAWPVNQPPAECD